MIVVDGEMVMFVQIGVLVHGISICDDDLDGKIYDFFKVSCLRSLSCLCCFCNKRM